MANVEDGIFNACDHDLKIHPVCLLIPEMDAEQKQALEDDILAKGGIEMPIVVFDDQIIDGRTRYEICKEHGLECPAVVWQGEAENLAAWVVSINVRRRHLTASQRAAIAAMAAKWKFEQFQKSDALKSASDLPAHQGKRGPRGGGRIAEQSAHDQGVSERHTYRAKRILDKDPELLQEVAEGKKTITQAERELECRNRGEDDVDIEVEQVEVQFDILDILGQEIPTGLLETFGADAVKLREAMKLADKARRLVEELMDNPISAYLPIDRIVTDLRNAKNGIKASLPHCVCPACFGKGTDCKTCKVDCGFLTEAVLKRLPRKAG